MKRLILLAILLVSTFGLQLLVTCSKPLESRTDPDLEPQEPIIITDTFVDTVTVFITDTTGCEDTILISDTVIVTDTVFIPQDTIFDTIFEDTLYITDTIVITDTIIDSDTVIVTDTVFDIDTLYIPKACDTVYITDTIVDTLECTDTVIVFVQDTTGVQTECARLSSHRQELVWLFQNDAGDHSIQFISNIDGSNPVRNLDVYIDGQFYSWDPHANSELIVQQNLGANVIIKVGASQPTAFGHPIDICVSLDPL
jgi:hypothetical protein